METLKAESERGFPMDASYYWDLFVETGAPEVYLLYQKEKHREGPAA